MLNTQVPDGGFGWVIVAACFLANTLLVGMSRSFGVIYIVLIERFDSSATQTAWVHALFNTTRMVFGPLSSVACERWGCRRVVMCGGLLFSAGVMCMGLASNIYLVYLTYGAIAGFGGAFIFTPTLIVIGQYFDKRKGTAMAVSTLGSGLGTVLFAPLYHLLFSTYGFSGAPCLIGAIMLHCIVAGALLRPVQQYLKPAKLVIELQVSGSEETPRDICDIKEHSPVVDSKAPLRPDSQSAAHTVEQNKDHSMAESHTRDETTVDKEANSCATRLSDHAGTKATVLPENQVHLSQANPSTYISASQISLVTIEDDSCSSRCVARLSLFKNLLFMLYSLNIICMPFCIQTIYLFLPRYAEENGIDKKTGALIVAAMGLSSTVGRLVLGVAFDTRCMRYRRRLLHSIIGVFFGLASSGIGLWQGVVPITLCASLSGFLEGGFHGQRATVLSEMVPAHMLALSVGYMICAQGVGNTLGPVLGGLWQGVVPITLCASLSGFLEGGFHGQRATVLSEMVPAHMLALSVGYMICAQGVGNTLGPVLGGVIRDVTESYVAVFVTGGVLFAGSSLIMLIHFLCTPRNH